MTQATQNLEKLPRWAQSEIQMLRRQVADLTEQLSAAGRITGLLHDGDAYMFIREGVQGTPRAIGGLYATVECVDPKTGSRIQIIVRPEGIQASTAGSWRGIAALPVSSNSLTLAEVDQLEFRPG